MFKLHFYSIQNLKFQKFICSKFWWEFSRKKWWEIAYFFQFEIQMSCENINSHIKPE